MNKRSTLDRFVAAVPVAVAGLVLLALFFWEASARKTPTIFTDELEWSQVSRAIAATGHGARRGIPVGFKSLYAYFIAPAWWIHSTRTAYSVAKYMDTLAMCLTAIPVYLTARLLVRPRTALVAGFGSICTSALFYAGFLIPEPLAYPVFAVTAYAGIRALAGHGRRWTVAAIVLALFGVLVRNELGVAIVTLGCAAAVLWVVGPQGQRLRRNWSKVDHAGAAILLVGAILVANAALGPHVTQWHVVTSTWQNRMWTLGLTSTAALAIGLGVLPLITGLASLWLPERRHEPEWRAFAAYLASAIVFFWLYTAVKAAYLSTQVFTRIEERNLIYLGPLLLVGTVTYFSSRPWLPLTLAAAGLTAFLVLYYGYQLDDPYFESPGYGIAAFANRDLRWTQHDIRIALAVATVVALGFALLPYARGRFRLLMPVAAALTVAWMLTGQITVAQGSASGSRALLGNFASPPDWIDRSTGSGGTTFMGQNLSPGQDVGVWLTEFWNRSIKHIWTLDGSAPGPGLTVTPDLDARNGRLSNDPGLPYVLETNGVDIIGAVVAQSPNNTLVRIGHPWRLRQAYYGRSDDGWITGANGDATAAYGTYAYFGPGTAPGKLDVTVGRPGFCHDSPGTNAVVRIGPVALNEQRAPVVRRATTVRRLHVADCSVNHIVVNARPPVAVQIQVAPLQLGTDYHVPDSRLFGAQIGATFTPAK